MIELRVSGQTFSEYVSISLTRSLGKTSGAFSIELSPTQIDSIMKRNVTLPIKVGDEAQVVIEGISKLKGYIDRVSGRWDQSSHEMSFVGRDTTQDLIDSSVPPAAKNIERTLTLAQFCTTVINALGADIPVIDTVGTLPAISSETDTFSAGSASNCMDYITSYARKVQAYIRPDGIGGLEIFRPSGTSTGASIINIIGGQSANLISGGFSIDNSNRFRKYACKSQDNFSNDPSADYKGLGTNRTGEVLDTEIRASRYIEIQGERSLSDIEAQRRTDEEANLRRIKSNMYSCVVAGFKGNNGSVWDIGQSCRISDNFAQKEGVYTITEVTYSYDLDNGSTTELVFSDPDAFKVRPTLGDYDAARSGQNNKNIKKSSGYADNDWINRGSYEENLGIR